MSKLIDLTGLTFGRLTVIEDSGKRSNNSVLWKCNCSCGNTVLVSSDNLRRGRTVSCGCYSRQNSTVDLVGERFGKITVIRDSGRRGSGRNVIWECQCDCSNTTFVESTNLRKLSTVSCGCLSESLVASELKKYLVETYSAIPEYKELINPQSNQYLPYDVFIPQYSAYVEVHGNFHYQQDHFFHKDPSDFEKRRRYDKIKKRHAKRNGIYIEIDLRKIKTPDEAIEYVENILS